MANTIDKVTLGDYVVSIKGSKPNILRDKPFKDSVPYLDISVLEKDQPSQYSHKYDSDLADDKDILVVWDGSRSGLTFKGKIGAIGSTLMCLKSDTINRDYLYYFLKHNYDFINGNLTGIGIPHVNSDLFFSLEIPHSKLIEQKKVISEIESKYSQNNVLRSKQQEILRKSLEITSIEFSINTESVENSIDNFKNAVLQNAITGKITADWRNVNRNDKVSTLFTYALREEYRQLENIPSNWIWAPLGDVAVCERGRFSARPRNDPYFFGGKYPFIQIGDIPGSSGRISTHKQTLNEEGIKVSKSFPKGTIVLAIVGSTIGNSGVLEYETYFTDSIVGLNGNHILTNEYLSLYLKKEKENLKRISYSSGGQPNLKLEYIRSYPIPVPPIEEQVEIVKKVNELFEIGDQLLNSYEKDSSLLDDLEKAILEQIFKRIGNNSEEDLVDSDFLLEGKVKIETELIKNKKIQSKFRKENFTQAKTIDEMKEYIKLTTNNKFDKDDDFHSHEILDEIINTIPKLDLDEFSEAFLELSQDKIESEQEKPFFISVNKNGVLKFKMNEIE